MDRAGAWRRWSGPGSSQRMRHGRSLGVPISQEAQDKGQRTLGGDATLHPQAPSSYRGLAPAQLRHEDQDLAGVTAAQAV